MTLKDFLEYADCKGVSNDDANLWLAEVGAYREFERSGFSAPLMFIYTKLNSAGRDKEAIDNIERSILERPKHGLVFTPRRGFGWPFE